MPNVIYCNTKLNIKKIKPREVVREPNFVTKMYTQIQNDADTDTIAAINTNSLVPTKINTIHHILHIHFVEYFRFSSLSKPESRSSL